MIRHYYTLCKVAEELQALRGYFLTECFTQEKNAVVFVFETRNHTATVECSIDSQTGTILRRREFNRARKNTMDLFAAARNRTLREVSMAANERVMTLAIGDVSLHCILFGGGKGNIVAEKDGVVIEALKGGKELVGMPYTAPQQQLFPLRDVPPNTMLHDALLHSEYLLAKPYALEVCRQCALDARAPLSSLSTEQWNNLVQCADAMRSACLQAQEFYLLRNKEGKPVFSLVRLEGYEVEQSFRSVSEAIRTRLASGHRASSFQQEQHAIDKQLRNQLHKAQRALQALERDAVHAAQESERRLYAELLLAQPNPHRKGMEHLVVTGWDGEEVTIPLKPALSLLDNAQWYFEKARTARDSASIREQRTQQYTERATALQQALDELASVQNGTSLAQFCTRYSRFFATMHKQSEQQERPYREFTLQDGYTLYVGKSAANNDELTMRFAKPNDYWFHARGVSGSHAVLRGGGDSSTPPKYVLEQAAAIAAYYSKARNAGYTPVAYTQKKYVRKPKGAAVGAVVIEREKVVMVKPGLPVQENA